MEFSQALTILLKFEGGYVNDPNDPGGETNLGISKRAYPDLDIASLTPETVAPLYQKAYWDAINADSLPENCKLMGFDCAVNQGPGLAKAIGQITQDPVIYAQHRAKHYLAAAEFSKYGLGWINRLLSVLGETYGSGG
jgi:lysozyme family protein